MAGAQLAAENPDAELLCDLLGRARRLATDPDGLSFREVARDAVDLAGRGPAGSLEAADRVLAARSAAWKSSCGTAWSSLWEAVPSC